MGAGGGSAWGCCLFSSCTTAAATARAKRRVGSSSCDPPCFLLGPVTLPVARQHRQSTAKSARGMVLVAKEKDFQFQAWKFQTAAANGIQNYSVSRSQPAPSHLHDVTLREDFGSPTVWSHGSYLSMSKDKSNFPKP